MSKQIFKTNTQGKPYQTKITKDKNLLKASLNKMLHPDICGRQFADMIKQLKEKQINILDQNKEFKNEKKSFLTKYSVYFLALSLNIMSLLIATKANKINNKIIKITINIISVLLIKIILDFDYYQNLIIFIYMSVSLEVIIAKLGKLYKLDKQISPSVLPIFIIYTNLIVPHFLTALFSHALSRTCQTSNRQNERFFFKIRFSNILKKSTNYIIEKFFTTCEDYTEESNEEFNKNENENEKQLMIKNHNKS